MERKLYDAAIKGDAKTLRELIHQDELILDRLTLTSFNETILHIATMKGHLEFVQEILNHNSLLAKEVDSRKSSPLHIASWKGNLEIVRELVRVDPGMCLTRDRDGRNPVHLAAIKGRVEVLKLLLQWSVQAALEKTNRGETTLHLCVKYDQLEAMKIVLAAIGGGGGDEVVAQKDNDGNTVLHLAVEAKGVEVIKYLINNTMVNLNERNDRGDTSLDIICQMQGDVFDLEISDIIRKAGGVRAKDMHTQNRSNHLASHSPRTGQNQSTKSNPTERNQASSGDWLSKKRDAIMVVASLIATMAFQAGMNPPGGVWQDDKGPFRAGESVMAHHNPKSYRYFIRANTVSFVSSLSTILLLISGLPFKHRLVMWFLMMIMWLTITASALTYAISIVVLTPSGQKHQLSRVIDISVTVWCCVMSLMLLGNTIRLILRSLKKKGKVEDVWPPSKWRKSIEVHHGNGSPEIVQIQLS